MQPGMQQEQELSLLDVLLILRDNAWLIAGSVLLAGAAALVYAFTATPVYRAQAVLIPGGTDKNQPSLSGQLGGLAAMAGVQLPGSGNAEVYIAQLQSRALATRFIEQQNLLPILFADQWDAGQGKWILPPGEEPPTAAQAYEIWKNIFSLSRERASSLVTVTLDHSERERVAQWLTQYIALVNEAIRQRDIAEAENQLRYLRAELEQTPVVEIQQAIYRLIESQIKTIMLAKSSTEYALQTLDPAVVPEADAAIFPKKKLILLMGLMLGGFVGALAAFLRHALRTAVLPARG